VAWSCCGRSGSRVLGIGFRLESLVYTCTFRLFAYSITTLVGPAGTWLLRKSEKCAYYLNEIAETLFLRTNFSTLASCRKVRQMICLMSPERNLTIITMRMKTTGGAFFRYIYCQPQTETSLYTYHW
jgi:hypothetical protein